MEALTAVPIEVHERTIAERVHRANVLAFEAYSALPWSDPVGCVQWIHVDQVQANDYNPNAVAHQEMRLLYISIEQDGFTQPIVAIIDPDSGKYIIVDGFHRYTIIRKYADIHDRTHGYLPIVVIDKPIEDRIASTVRHNRARGKHSVKGMGSLVFQMLREGQDDATICNKLGLEAEELLRLKHITGYSKLYADHEYSRPMQSTAQLKAKANYRKENPDEFIPNF